MNDEEFINSMPSLIDEAPTEEVEQEEELLEEELHTENEEQEAEESSDQDGVLVDDVFSTESVDETDSSTEQEESEEDPTEEEQEPQQEESSSTGSIDLQNFFNEVTAPFRANGKEVQVNSAEDVRRLMQMGANYTKKMQEIAPYRKALIALENNNLLDTERINFLVDLNNKKPEAIKQLLKEAELSAYDLDDSSYDDEDAPQYVPGDHTPSDQELALREVMEDVRALPGGETTIIDITKTWDDESKNVLWENPGLLSTIHTQRQNGIYDTITREMERRQVLGQLPAHLSFLSAYQAVGEELDAAGAFNHLVQGQPAKPKPTAVTKGKVRNNATQNDNRAKAASISRGNSKHKTKLVDLTELDDDKFLEAMSKII